MSKHFEIEYTIIILSMQTTEKNMMHMKQKNEGWKVASNLDIMYNKRLLTYDLKL